MLTLQNITYGYPGKDTLFDNINFTIGRQDKAALVGNNGTGKSTILRIMAGILQPASGSVRTETKPYYIPQHYGQFSHMTIAAALGVEERLHALKEILGGNVTEENMSALADDWNIEERCHEALTQWGFKAEDLFCRMDKLSGGEKTKVFLAGIAIHRPQIVLMDEPSNHLDSSSREMLYSYIKTTGNALVIVSHDRTLLNLLSTVYELNRQGITAYGGNYDFYAGQKEIAAQALTEDLKEKEKALRKAKETEREAMERQQKLDARGKKKQEKAGLPTIVMNGLRNNAEKSTARMKDVHAEKTGSIAEELSRLRRELPDKDKMKIGFDDSSLHKGKILVTAKDINFSYNNRQLWNTPLNFVISSGQRIAIKGGNGSGKTTLVRLMLGELKPAEGELQAAAEKVVYIDQDYSLVDNRLNVYGQAQQFNTAHLQEHEVKSRLTHFLFTSGDWDKSTSVLSGGEKMRLLLCCITLSDKAPDMIILDEPTNNLDIQNIEILTAAVKDYKGTLIVISHDAYFLEEVNVQGSIELA